MCLSRGGDGSVPTVGLKCTEIVWFILSNNTLLMIASTEIEQRKFDEDIRDISPTSQV